MMLNSFERGPERQEVSEGESQMRPFSQLKTDGNLAPIKKYEEYLENSFKHAVGKIESDNSNNFAPSKREGSDRTDASDTSEKKETDSPEVDDVNEKQREAIREALLRLLRGEELTTAEKGNLCEMMMDQYYIARGYTPLNKERITSLDAKGHHGIDGVYEKDGAYVVADAKYGSAKLDDTADGKQLSGDWIDKRLDNAVGKEKADEIRDAMEDDPDCVSTEVYHYDPDCDQDGVSYSDTYHVDEDGNKCDNSTTVERHHNGKSEVIESDQEGDI